MFLVGLSQGPPHHYWYIWLDKLLPKRNLKTVIYNQQCFKKEFQILKVLISVFTLLLFCISPFMILGGYENSCRSIFCSAVLCNHLHFWYGAIRRQTNIRMLERVHHEISSYLSCKFIRISFHQQGS